MAEVRAPLAVAVRVVAVVAATLLLVTAMVPLTTNACPGRMRMAKYAQADYDAAVAAAHPHLSPAARHRAHAQHARTRNQLRRARAHQHRALQPSALSAVASPTADLTADYHYDTYPVHNDSGFLIIGTPVCTMGAHARFPTAAGPCPNMEQPAALGPAPTHALYRYPNNFVHEWRMFFIPDETDTPPYGDNNLVPRTAYNVTTGRTYYTVVDAEKEIYSMQETFDQFCVPLFFDLTSPLAYSNNYSCKQLNVGGVAYAILSDDRPESAPECCIVGQPMYAPSPSWADGMARRWRDMDGDVPVDWNASWDAEDGIHAFGWNSNTTYAHALYSRGPAYLANWVYMLFGELQEVEPPASVWEVPEACASATPCMGSYETWVAT